LTETLQQTHERNYLKPKEEKKKKEDITLKDMDVLMNWILFTSFIFGAFASEEKEKMDWFQNLHQDDKDDVVQLLSQGIEHYGNFNEDVVHDIEQKFGINSSQTQQLYKLLYLEKPQNQFSKKDNGVILIKDGNRWKVQLVHNKKVYFYIVISNREQATMIANLLFEKYKKKEHLPAKEVGTIWKKFKFSTSIYTGVSWNRDCKKWQVKLSHNGKQYNGGYFDNEEHAAMTINLLCDEYGIQRKNLTIDIEPDVIQKSLQRTKSTIAHNDEDILIQDECENRFMHFKSSQYIGVTWNEKNGKWHAQLTHNKKEHDGDHFGNQKTAAMSVNLLCDKFKIKRKNPTIDMKLKEDEIRAINNALNQIILFDLQQVAQDQQKKSFLWPLFDSPGLTTVILSFLITDYNPAMHKIEFTPHISIGDESNMQKRKRKESDTCHDDDDLQDKKE